MNDPEIPSLERLKQMSEDAENWQCECGAVCTSTSQEWRWTGKAWQHHHGNQAGHVDAHHVADQCTCGEPRVQIPSGRIVHRYDGQPCYIKNA